MPEQTRTLKLSQNRECLIDADDYEFLSQWKWYCNHGYAVRSKSRSNGSHIRLHRVLMQPEDGFWVDHINGDTLDNRRSNLRLCTVSGNNHNRMKSKNNTSGYKGVSWLKQNQKWRAYIKVNSKDKHLGCYLDKEDAARAYDKAAKEYFGEFARLNFA